MKRKRLFVWMAACVMLAANFVCGHAQTFGTAVGNDVLMYDQVDFLPSELVNGSGTTSYRIVNVGDKVWAYFKMSAPVNGNILAVQLRNFGKDGAVGNKKEMNLERRTGDMEAYISSMDHRNEPAYYKLRAGEADGVKFQAFVVFTIGGVDIFTCSRMISFAPGQVNNTVPGDITAPVLTDASAAVEGDNVNLTFTASDNNGFFYYITDEANGIEEVAFANTFSFPKAASTVYNLKIVAVDYNGNISGAKTVTAETSFDPTTNQAVNKSAYASSNVADASKGNDGNRGSRWQADGADKIGDQAAEWWYVDLGAAYNLSKIQILWEGAYAKKFKIQTALELPQNVAGDEGWTSKTFDRTIENISKDEELIITSPARYVKFQAIERALDYGSSFYEFAVYASSRYVPLDEDPILSKVTIANAEVIAGEETPLLITATNQVEGVFEGAVITVAADPADGVTLTNRDGVYYARGVKAGNYTLTVTATAGDVTKTATGTLLVKEARKVAKIEISSKSGVFAVADPVEMTVNCTDQYGDKITGTLTWEAEGGSVAGNIYTAAKKGLFKIKAVSGDVYSNELMLNIVAEGENIAFGKTVVAYPESSQATAANAVDNNQNSMWVVDTPTGGNLKYDASISIDLGKSYTIYLLEIYWEGAFSKNFTVEYSEDNQLFGKKYEKQNVDKLEIHKFYDDPAVARYVKIHSTEAATGYGTKIREVRAFGSATGLSVNELSDVNVTVYPNPVSDRLFIANMEVSGVAVYTIQGSLVLSAGNCESIDVSSLTAGIYIVRITDRYENVVTRKIQVR